MPSRYRKKPLAQFEHGTRVYAPSGGDTHYGRNAGTHAFLSVEDELDALGEEPVG